MQTHYCELRAIPQEDRTQNQVISDLVQVLHRYLPAYNNQDNQGNHAVALSFPVYGRGRSLGGIIRLHGREANLAELRQALAPVSGYVLIGAVEKVPASIKGYAVFIRRQYKGLAAARRLKARYEKRADKQWNDELAAAIVQKYSNHQFVPFVQIQSSSTGQPMRLHIEKRSASREIRGPFTGYGLSKSIEGQPLATVPLF